MTAVLIVTMTAGLALAVLTVTIAAVMMLVEQKVIALQVLDVVLCG